MGIEGCDDAIGSVFHTHTHVLVDTRVTYTTFIHSHSTLATWVSLNVAFGLRDILH